MLKELRVGEEYDCGGWQTEKGFGRVTVRREADGYHVLVVKYERATLRKAEVLYKIASDLSWAKDAAWALSVAINEGRYDPFGCVAGTAV